MHDQKSLNLGQIILIIAPGFEKAILIASVKLIRPYGTLLNLENHSIDYLCKVRLA